MSASNDLTDICFFMGRLAHEMNNRLSMILMTVDSALLSDKSGHDQSDDCLRMIKDQSSIMSHIVEAIQVLTSIPAQKPKPVDVNQLIARSVELVKFLHSTKSNKFVTNLAQTRPIVLVDKVYMEKCLLILFENALLSMPKDGQITITTQEQDKVRITISYNAPDVLQSQKKCIRYSTISTKNEEKLALQLGLGLLERIVTLFDGDIEAESSEQTGTLITIILPTYEYKSGVNETDYMPKLSPIDQNVVFSTQSGGLA